MSDTTPEVSRSTDGPDSSALSAERTRVLILVKGLGIGGAERLISSGAAHWDTNRFDYQVAYVLPWKNALVPDLERLGVQVTCIGGARGMDPATAWRWRRLVRQVKPHLIHAHLPSTGILARVVGGAPVVYTEHNIASSYRLPTRWANRLTYRRNAATIAVSGAVADSLRDFPGPTAAVIENGVSVDVPESTRRQARMSLGLDENTPLVVHVGNIRPHKGHQNLIEAAEILFAKHSNVEIVSIGGEKHPGDLARIRTEAERRGVSDRLRFMGTLPNAVDFIAAADIFANPADVEGLPVAILEAQALAKPVVATAVGGVPSAVIDDRTGLLVPAQDPAALAGGLLDLLEDSTRARALGVGAKQLVEERYGLPKMIGRYEDVYSRVLSSADSASSIGNRA